MKILKLDNLSCLVVQTTNASNGFITYMPVLTPIIAGVAAGIAFYAFKRQRKLHQEKLSHDFEAYYQTDSDLIYHRNKINEFILNSTAIESDLKILANSLPDNPTVISIQFILNSWERCSHAIREGLYDEDYLFSIVSTRAIKAFHLLEPYIEVRRKKSGGERAYINYRWLITKWLLKIEIYEATSKGVDKAVIPALDNVLIWQMTKRSQLKRRLKFRKQYRKIASFQMDKF